MLSYCGDAFWVTLITIIRRLLLRILCNLIYRSCKTSSIVPLLTATGKCISARCTPLESSNLCQGALPPLISTPRPISVLRLRRGFLSRRNLLNFRPANASAANVRPNFDYLGRLAVWLSVDVRFEIGGEQTKREMRCAFQHGRIIILGY